MEASLARVPVFTLAATMMLGGCMVGTEYVKAPERLPSKDLPELVHPVTFDVCISPDIRPLSAFERERRKVGDRIQKQLVSAGVPAELTPVAGSPVTFTVTSSGSYEGPAWSFWLSFFTLSVVPGYFAQHTTLDVNFGQRDAAENEHLLIGFRSQLFIWLPLLVHPDVFAGLNGGWESSKKHDDAFDRTVERLGDELRLRLGRDGGASRPNEGRAVCPRAGASTQRL
jgi:hypothetical protein